MAANSVLIPISQALPRFPKGAEPSHTTMHRWGKKYPGLVVRIGGRDFIRPETADAIAAGMPLADAARIGAGGGRAA